jgi:hypothetical protein
MGTMLQRHPETSEDISQVEALVRVSSAALTARLQQVARERDPLADALQQSLARESREAYLKDWRTSPIRPRCSTP